MGQNFNFFWSLKGPFFERYENDVCYYVTDYQSRKYTFTSASDIKVTEYGTPDCSGSSITMPQLYFTPEYKDCPKYVGFTVAAGDNCKYESKGIRTYMKEGCQDIPVLPGSVQFYVEGNKLKQKVYSTDNCSGDPVSTEIAGEYKTGDISDCGKCQGTTYFQCGTVANFVIALFALIFFLF